MLIVYTWRWIVWFITMVYGGAIWLLLIPRYHGTQHSGLLCIRCTCQLVEPVSHLRPAQLGPPALAQLSTRHHDLCVFHYSSTNDSNTNSNSNNDEVVATLVLLLFSWKGFDATLEVTADSLATLPQTDRYWLVEGQICRWRWVVYFTWRWMTIASKDYLCWLGPQIVLGRSEHWGHVLFSSIFILVSGFWFLPLRPNIPGTQIHGPNICVFFASSQLHFGLVIRFSPCFVLKTIWQNRHLHLLHPHRSGDPVTSAPVCCCFYCRFAADMLAQTCLSSMDGA